MLLRVFSAACVVLLAACSGDAAIDMPDAGMGMDSGVPDAGPGMDSGAPDSGMPPAETPLVVSIDWLADNLDNPNIQVVDSRVMAAFDESRIPGAIHLRPEQLAMADGAVPSQVAPPELAEPVLRAAGLRNDTIVVVYGEPPEFDPARIVWTLRYYNHGDVRYLDGGFPGWVADDGLVDDGAPVTEATDYMIGSVNEGLRFTSGEVLTGIGDPPYTTPSIQLVDARSPPEFDAGRIPTARLVQWTDNLEAGFLRSIPEIESLHAGLDGDTTTVTYCLIGWRGSVAWLALKYLGFDDVRLYDGSWAEWGNGQFPVEQ